MLELLYGAVLEQNARMAICGHQVTGELIDWPRYTQTASSLFESEQYYVEHNLNATTAWGKLYHKTCFEHLRFPVGKVHEDEYTTYRILFDLKTVAVIDAPLYAYYSNPQGITKSGNKLNWLHALSAFEEQLAYFKSIGAEKAYSYRIANYYIELSLFPRQLSSSNPEESAAKHTLQEKKKRIFAQMTSSEKKIAYNYLHPRAMALYSRISRCIELLKKGGISALIAALKRR